MNGVPQPARSWAGLGAWVAALALAAGAQAAFRSDAHAAGVLATLAALGAALAFVRLAPGARELGGLAPPATPESLRPSRPAWAAGAVLALGLVVALAHLDRGYALQLGAFAAALIALGLAWRPRGARPWARRELLWVAGLLAIALLARLYHLERVPGGLYGDEGEFGLVARTLLDGDPLPPFSIRWDHHPTLFAWLQAGAMGLAGVDGFGLRLASALAGALTVVPVYALMRSAFGLGAGLAAGVLMATSPFHGHLTRLASNNAFVALLLASAMAALWLGARSARARPYAVAGACTGLAFYFGNKAVAVPPAVALGLVALAAAGGPAVRRQSRLWLLVPAVALLVLVPQLVYYATHDFYGPVLFHPLRRMAEVPAARDPAFAGFLVGQLERALLGLQAFPDTSLFRVPNVPFILGRAEATLYTVGVACALATIRQPGSAFLLAWLGLGVGTSLFDARPPWSHHLIGISMVPAAFSALAVVHGAAAARAALGRPALAALLAAALVAWSGIDSLYAYHWTAARSWTSEGITELGRTMAAYDPDHQLVMVAPHIMWRQNSTLRFVARGIAPAATHRTLDPRTRWFEPDGRDVVFLVDARNPRDLRAVRNRYPRGTPREYRGGQGRLLVTAWLVPARDVVERRFPPPPPEARRH